MEKYLIFSEICYSLAGRTRANLIREPLPLCAGPPAWGNISPSPAARSWDSHHTPSYHPSHASHRRATPACMPWVVPPFLSAICFCAAATAPVHAYHCAAVMLGTSCVPTCRCPASPSVTCIAKVEPPCRARVGSPAPRHLSLALRRVATAARHHNDITQTPARGQRHAAPRPGHVDAACWPPLPFVVHACAPTRRPSL
jgi:hypothetical protein